MGLDEEKVLDEMRARFRNYLYRRSIPKERVMLIEKLRSLVEASEKELKVPASRISR